MANERVEVMVSKVIPLEIQLPEPVLVTTAGTSLVGRSPSVAAVADGDRSNSMIAAPANVTVDRSANKECRTRGVRANLLV